MYIYVPPYRKYWHLLTTSPSTIVDLFFFKLQVQTVDWKIYMKTSFCQFLLHTSLLWKNPDYLELQKAEFQKLFLVDYIQVSWTVVGFDWNGILSSILKN